MRVTGNKLPWLLFALFSIDAIQIISKYNANSTIMSPFSPNKHIGIKKRKESESDWQEITLAFICSF